MTTTRVDVQDLERRVKEVYRQVAQRPQDTYHFEMGRPLAERLGYPADLLDLVPAAALDSFAGVGYYLDLAAPAGGEQVLDLGSGSGTDSFAVAALVGAEGHVTGVDMTDEQLAKANELRDAAGMGNVAFLRGYIQSPRSPMPALTWSCPTVSSTWCRTRTRCSARSPVPSFQEGDWPWPTS